MVFKLLDDVFLLLFVGDLCMLCKNFGIVLKVLMKLFVNVYFVVVGYLFGSLYLEEVCVFGIDLCVYFFGFVKNMLMLMCLVDVYVFLLCYEVMSLLLLEVMVVGLLVVIVCMVGGVEIIMCECGIVLEDLDDFVVFV